MGSFYEFGISVLDFEDLTRGTRTVVHTRDFRVDVNRYPALKLGLRGPDEAYLFQEAEYVDCPLYMQDMRKI